MSIMNKICKCRQEVSEIENGDPVIVINPINLNKKIEIVEDPC